jgi:lipid II:glycine glycyltransferase (peptidoglycan interpeptide bridge formation enzyme)
MKIVDIKFFNFNIKEVYLSDYPFDIDGCDFLKFLFCKNKVEIDGFAHQNKFTLVIDLTKNLDIIWQNMGKHCRKYTKRAQKDDLEININKNYHDFYKINKSLTKSIGRGVRARVLIPKIDIMKRYATLFTIKHNNDILAGHLYLENDDQIFLWHSASARFHFKEEAKLIGRASRLLHWEAIKYAKQKNLTIFDFGGIWSEVAVKNNKSKQGINLFKMQFGGKIEPRHLYYKFYSNTYKLAYNIFGNLFTN